MEPTLIQEPPPRPLRESKAPGVYEYESFGAPHRTYFSTGVPVFLGTMSQSRPAIAKETKPVPHMLSLWSQFLSQVGEAYAGCYLASAVRGFFENGGHWCYVVVLKDRETAALQAGLQAIAALNSIDLVCAPDLHATKSIAIDQQQLVVEHCDDMADRFVILDSRLGDVPDAVWNQWSGINGRNGALYYPWIRVNGFAGKLETVPPCGHIAGVYSATDRARGVHKAPANVALEGVIDLERQITNHDQDFLNPKNVNCLRAFPGKGIRVWGARTISGQPAWVWINVRRLFLTAARWMDWNLAEIAFEPNNAKLWARIERKLTEYFAGLYRQGALKGATLQQAFYVKCDGETNSPETQSLGQVVTEIGLAPAIPYEFIVVRLIRGTRGAHL